MRNLGEWYILQINEYIEQVDFKDIESAITDIFGPSVEYFIPITYEKIGSYTFSFSLLEGYAFIRDSESVRVCLSDIRGNKFFSGALMLGGKFRTVSSYTIGSLKRKLLNLTSVQFNKGDKVRIIKGTYCKLCGIVSDLSEDKKTAVIEVNCQTKKLLIHAPLSALEYDNGSSN